MSTTLTYEKTPIAKTAHRKAMAKLTNDITKLSTIKILAILYRRHETNVWIIAFWLLAALFVWSKLG